MSINPGEDIQKAGHALRITYTFLPEQLSQSFSACLPKHLHHFLCFTELLDQAVDKMVAQRNHLWYSLGSERNEP